MIEATFLSMSHILTCLHRIFIGGQRHLPDTLGTEKVNELFKGEGSGRGRVKRPDCLLQGVLIRVG